MAYADYDYYKNTYLGVMLESDFIKQATKATRCIDNITRERAKAAPVSMQDKLAQCCCVIADTLHETANLPVGAAGIASEHNDGYSVSYQSEGGKSEKAKVLNIIADYLTYPVNLMYLGVG